ncbi:MAG: ABC transporter substrate-binding protein [Chloroflexi bacterium]|nr:ABC transporter substrate-binding protein [Chloroflexota bacterium]
MFHPKRNILILLVCLLLALPALTLADGHGNTLIMARAVDATGLDPHTQTAFASFALLGMIYEPLITLDRDLNLTPALAESWSFSEDGLALTMNLRSGVTFHDGSAFDAEDVIASYERILDEETGSAARTNYLSIVSMDAPDEHTVVFNLDKPDVPLLSAMSTINASILSSDVISMGDPAVDIIGTGPFALDSWVADETTQLSANEAWWGGEIAIDGIEIRIIPEETSIIAAMRAGNVHFAMINDPLVATLVEGEDDVQITTIPTLSYNGIQLRAAREPLEHLEARQAISCAINRQEILDTASLGQGIITGPLTMASYALPVSELFCYEQDVEKARELLAAAGLQDGFTLDIMVAVAEPPTALSIAQIVQSQLAEVNITVEIESLEFSTYVDRWLAADFMGAVVLNSGFTDPYPMYARYWQEGAIFQDVAGYLDDTLDGLMKAGQIETDPDVRYEIFRQFQLHLAETVPWIWLYTNFTYTAQLPSVIGWNPGSNRSLKFLADVSLSS